MHVVILRQCACFVGTQKLRSKHRQISRPFKHDSSSLNLDSLSTELSLILFMWIHINKKKCWKYEVFYHNVWYIGKYNYLIFYIMQKLFSRRVFLLHFIDLLAIFEKSIDLDALHNNLLRKCCWFVNFMPFLFSFSRIVYEKTFYPL